MGVLRGHTIVVAVHAVEHEPQPLLVSLQVLGKLLEVQQAIVVDVALEDYLWGAESHCHWFSGEHRWIKMGGAGRDGRSTLGLYKG